MAKKKHQGHYCKVCGEYKSNENFSGKDHKNHICKKCAQLPMDVREDMMRDDLKDNSESFGDIELPFEVNDGEEQSPDTIYYDGYLVTSQSDTQS